MRTGNFPKRAGRKLLDPGILPVDQARDCNSIGTRTRRKRLDGLHAIAGLMSMCPKGVGRAQTAILALGK
jgi:hypothetical protein